MTIPAPYMPKLLHNHGNVAPKQLFGGIITGKPSSTKEVTNAAKPAVVIANPLIITIA
jgi:hypothetical protein